MSPHRFPQQSANLLPPVPRRRSASTRPATTASATGAQQPRTPFAGLRGELFAFSPSAAHTTQTHFPPVPPDVAHRSSTVRASQQLPTHTARAMAPAADPASASAPAPRRAPPPEATAARPALARPRGRPHRLLRLACLVASLSLASAFHEDGHAPSCGDIGNCTSDGRLEYKMSLVDGFPIRGDPSGLTLEFTNPAENTLLDPENPELGYVSVDGNYPECIDVQGKFAFAFTSRASAAHHAARLPPPLNPLPLPQPPTTPNTSTSSAGTAGTTKGPTTRRP